MSKTEKTQFRRTHKGDNPPIVSIIVTHQNRIRCLLSELLDNEIHRFKNASIVKLIIKKEYISVELVYDGELTKSNSKKYYKMNGGNPCYNFQSYNESSKLCTSNNEINNAIKINGDGKCGWYSIFVYLKLLYLHHIDHFDKSKTLQAIRKYFDKHTDIFVQTNNGISVKNTHFIELINLLGTGINLERKELIMDDEQSVKPMLENYMKHRDNKLKQFEFSVYSSFIRKHILAPMYLINNENGNFESMRHWIYFDNDSYDIPPLIMIRSVEDNSGHFDLINNITNNDNIYSDSDMIKQSKIKINDAVININKLNSKKPVSPSSIPVSPSSIPVSPSSIPIAYPFKNNCDNNGCTINVINASNKIKIENLNNREHHFYLIRHGEATHNLYKRKLFGRKYDTSLTPMGLVQASRAGDALKKMKIKPNYIFVSDLKRTHQTLEAIYDTYKENVPEVFALQCAHELKYKKGRKSRRTKGYCDGSRDFSKFIKNENKTSCKSIENCNKHILGNILDWKYYETFYNKDKKRKRNTRRNSKKSCKNTNMIEQAIKIISQKEKNNNINK